VGHPCLLARLGKLSDDALRDLLETGWQFERSTRAAASRRRK
jgi:hypothetical protein